MAVIANEKQFKKERLYTNKIKIKDMVDIRYKEYWKKKSIITRRWKIKRLIEAQRSVLTKCSNGAEDREGMVFLFREKGHREYLYFWIKDNQVF